MSGNTTTQQQQQQNSTTNPWAPSQPMLQSILSQIGGSANYAPTAGQTTAANTLVGEAAGIPSYLPQGENAVSSNFNFNTTPQQNITTGAYNTAAGALSPFLQPGYMNPATNPYLKSAMGTLNTDISNQIEGTFAGAGRGGQSFYGGPSNAAEPQAIARGLAQGEGQLLTNQYNTNANQVLTAGSELPTISAQTTGGLTQEQLASIEAGNQGIALSSAIPGLATQPGQAQWQAAGLNANLPISNLSGIAGLVDPIAGLGGQMTGSSSGTTTQGNPNFGLGAGLAGLGMLGGTGFFGNGGGGWNSGWGSAAMSALPGLLGMFSDERVKEDIEKVGELYDETPVYSYRYKGDPRPQIGLLAQDIERRRPDAVHNFPGTDIKMVDYGRATERARRIGMLADLAMAA